MLRAGVFSSRDGLAQDFSSPNGESMNDGSQSLSASVLNALRAQVRGATIIPSDDAYTAARRVWNGAIDRHPSAIIVCADAEDVSIALRIAAANGLQMTVRGGG